MFDKLTERLQGVIESLRAAADSPKTISPTRCARCAWRCSRPMSRCRSSRRSSRRSRAKVVGQEIEKSLTPGQALVSLIHQELIALMGEGVRPLNLRAQPPVVILLAGLQGAGKTTSAGKLAKWLKENERKRVLLASTDVYRPAAILQLQRLAEQLDVAFFPSDPKKPP